MSAELIIVLLAAAVLVVTSAVVLILVIVGIHGEERHVSLPERPHCCSEILARRVLDLHVSRPDALRILSERIKDKIAIDESMGHIDPNAPGSRRPWRELADNCAQWVLVTQDSFTVCTFLRAMTGSGDRPQARIGIPFSCVGGKT